MWSKEQPFPIDIEYMITDTLELLRPKMKLCSSLDEACAQVTQLERELLVKLGITQHCVCVCVAMPVDLLLFLTSCLVAFLTLTRSLSDSHSLSDFSSRPHA